MEKLTLKHAHEVQVDSILDLITTLDFRVQRAIYERLAELFEQLSKSAQAAKRENG